MILLIVGLLSGLCASLGIGGGFVLLLYLTAAAGMPQIEGQLVNLIFFLPIALFSLIFHIRHGLVDFQAVRFSVVGGLLGVLCGGWAAASLGSQWLSRLFALFILLVGLRELFTKAPAEKSPYPDLGPRAQ